MFFNKKTIIGEIKEMLKQHPKWLSFDTEGLYCDLWITKKVEIQEQISIKENPFNHYKNIVTSVYQIAIAIDVEEPGEDIDQERIDRILSWATRYVVVDSPKALSRILKEYKE